MSTESKTLEQHIGRAVHELLWDRRIAQRQLAAHLGLDETMVSKMLRGNRAWTIRELCGTADFLGVPVPDLLPEQESTAWAPLRAPRTHTRVYRSARAVAARLRPRKRVAPHHDGHRPPTPVPVSPTAANRTAPGVGSPFPYPRAAERVNPVTRSA